MRIAVIQFPGSNCDRDCLNALRSFPGVDADLVWHQESSVAAFDAIVLPGGFSYGDYLRCGAIARFSPVMGAVASAAQEGRLIMGICNGFQILCEAGLLPGALVRNANLQFICEHRRLRVDSCASPFTKEALTGAILRIPIAHGEGCYVADDATLRELNHRQQVLVRYCDEQGAVTPSANPNGSRESIAGICNRERNVFGLMPHPERAFEAQLGSSDGRVIFQSMIQTLKERGVK